MNTQAVQEFLKQLGENAELQMAVAEIQETEETEEGYVSHIIKLAAKHGYNFSAEELVSEMANRQKEFEQQMENLSEEELEAIAGGGWGFIGKGANKVFGLLGSGRFQIGTMLATFTVAAKK